MIIIKIFEIKEIIILVDKIQSIDKNIIVILLKVNHCNKSPISIINIEKK
jgi:hypothetical protein